MTQNYRTFTFGSPKDPCVVLLHGFLGTARNLYTLGQKVSEAGYFVLAYDQRGHGLSPHFSAEKYTLEEMANDLFHILSQNHIEKAHLVGHSMGGRVALEAAIIAKQKGNNCFLSLTMLDVGIDLHQEAYNELDKIISPLPEFFENKEDETNFLACYSEQMRAFLSSNLRTDDQGKRRWIFDLVGLRSAFKKVLFLKSQAEGFRGLTIPITSARGENSKHFRSADQNRLKELNPKTHLVTIPNAQHWVHADNLNGTLKVIIDSLSR
ncbi:MAG: alpha/beta fold hydrolase [Bacteriovoracia bacterium]